MSIFLLYYPVRLGRNVVFYSIGYAVYFLTKATALFMRTLGHYVAPQIGTVLLSFPRRVCYFGLSLNRQGEILTVVIGHKWKSWRRSAPTFKIKGHQRTSRSGGKEVKIPRIDR